MCTRHVAHPVTDCTSPCCTVATVAADEAFIRPFARDVIITLGVVMYAFVTDQAALGGRVLRIVETAALRADTYYDLMVSEGGG